MPKSFPRGDCFETPHLPIIRSSLADPSKGGKEEQEDVKEDGDEEDTEKGAGKETRASRPQAEIFRQLTPRLSILGSLRCQRPTPTSLQSGLEGGEGP
jgi:hypothetical protein